MAATNRQAWVQGLLPLAQQWEGRTGIPASIWIAMAASESNWGNTTGLFGIKGSGTAGSKNSATWESVNGQRVDTNADFAAYNQPNEAFQAFWDLMHTQHYAGALAKLPDDPSGFLHAINDANYATDPTWASMIERTARTTIAPMIQDRPGGLYMAGQQTDNLDQLTPEQFASIIQLHGGYISVNPVEKRTPSSDPDFAGMRSQDTVIQNLQFTLRDGKKLNVHLDPTMGATLSSGNPQGAWVVDSGSTALEINPSSSSSGGGVTGSNTKDQFISHRDPTTGALTWEPNPNYVPPTAPPPPRITSQNSSTSDKYVMQTDPVTGNVTWVPNQNYVDPVATPKFVDPTLDALHQAQTVQAQAAAALDTAQADKIQQSLRPLVQTAFQEYHATLDALKAQYNAGTISWAQMTSLGQQAYSALAATMAGTTLSEQQKMQSENANQRGRMSTDLLNQRVQSATSLGASLFNSATGHVLMPPGQTTLGIDPMAIANEEVNQMGGGQVTGDMAAAFLRSLLGGGDGGSSPSSGGPGNDQFPTTREGVLAQYPHLGQTGPAMGIQQPAGGQAAAAPSVASSIGMAGPRSSPNALVAALLASVGQGPRQALSALGSPTSLQ